MKIRYFQGKHYRNFAAGYADYFTKTYITIVCLPFNPFSVSSNIFRIKQKIRFGKILTGYIF